MPVFGDPANTQIDVQVWDSALLLFFRAFQRASRSPRSSLDSSARKARLFPSNWRLACWQMYRCPSILALPISDGNRRAGWIHVKKECDTPCTVDCGHSTPLTTYLGIASPLVQLRTSKDQAARAIWNLSLSVCSDSYDENKSADNETVSQVHIIPTDISDQPTPISLKSTLIDFPPLWTYASNQTTYSGI
ncbi:uncharacterized protein PGTG_08853 [Puccinia graminis f. sp. tritici CRL 75-36-700-3]|uniref:Uncharacterized protein n=2 Tax=Puccinia graminis f. sp. tritici TaxID=56615 RepID=E3KEC4_PUCGT|nr:uncharacterized protein PGTG_08853 [Puccinia graminis f. sp. tritici CRL 75-36-700-3]EFP82657.1 hypothetical protein PGTG_08853 [Puccinia graminis f. sp. tritici CRL 75-36-700-3]